ncbi:hypothetical protein HK102_011439, partial [Quaeritorhiza haematococci]
AHEVRTPPGNLPGLRPLGLPELPPGDPALAEGQAPHAADDPPGAGRRQSRPPGLHRPPREPRRQRLLPQPVRPRRDPHARRRRRVEHHDPGGWRGLADRAARPHRLPALVGAALLGLHLLLRLPGQQRRIQVDGPGALRPADLQGRDPRTADGPQARRLVLAGHGLLPVLPGPDDDRRPLPRAVRRAAAVPRIEPRTAPHGPGREHPVGDRGGRPADRPRGGPEDRGEKPRHGRRRGAQLRRQRPAAPRGALRGYLDPARGRRRRRRARGGALRGGSLALRDRGRAGRAGGVDPGRGEDRRLVPGPHGVRPPLARGAEHHRRPPVAGHAGDDEPQDQVPRELPPVRPGRPPRPRVRLVRHRPEAREPVHAPRRARPRRQAHAGRRRAAEDDAGGPGPPPPRQRRPLRGPGRHPRRLQRPAPARRR